MRVVSLPFHLPITHARNVGETTVRARRKGRLNDATEVYTRTKWCCNHAKAHSDPPIGRQISKITLSDPPIGRQILKTTLADPPIGRQISKTTLADPPIGRQISKTTLADPLIGRQILKTTLADPLMGRQILKTTLADPLMGCFYIFKSKKRL